MPCASEGGGEGLGRAVTAAGRGHLAMLLFSALVAGSFSLGALVANDIAPAALTALRFFLSAVLLGAVAAPRFRRAHLAGSWRWLLLGGIYAVYFVLMFEGLKTAAPVSASAVFTLTPIMSAGFGWLLLRQVTTPRMAAAIAIGAAGAMWVIFRADLAALLAFEIGRGEAIFFVGVIAHAAVPAVMRRCNRGEPAMVASALTTTAGFLILLFWGWGELRATDWGALSWQVWAVLGYLSVFTSAVTFFLIQYASLRLPSAKVMAYTYLVPAWVIGWEMGLGHGAPALPVFAGVVLIVVALVALLKDEEAGRAVPPRETARNRPD